MPPFPPIIDRGLARRWRPGLVLLALLAAGCPSNSPSVQTSRAGVAVPVPAAVTTEAVATAAATAATAAPRAVWVWEADTFRLLDQEESWADAFAFLDRHRLSILYLYADEYRGRNVLIGEPDKYRELIAAVHRRGGRVYALLGSYYLNTPQYILPEKRAVAVRMFERVLRYNAASETESRFDGVNIDIEPYLLDDWREKLPRRAAQYLDLGAEYMRLKRVAGETLAVGPALPFWFDGIEDLEWRGEARRLSEHVQDLFDYVALMDYRNYARGSDSIISHAADEIAYADRVGKAVVIGVETGQSSPRKVTFYGMSEAAMEQELAFVEAEYHAHPSFAGFAIHHLETYRALTGARPR